MIILGLTGSIGMGKSTTASMFRERSIPVYDADAEVHSLYTNNGAAVGPLSERFPEAVRHNDVDRSVLRQIITDAPERLVELEQIVHPLVAQSQIDFRAEHKSSNAPFVVLDIPLLFETGGDRRCDYVAVVTAPASVQRDRVLARPGMEEDSFTQILAKQTPDAEKRARADFVISTAFGLDFAREHVDAIIGLMNGLAV